MKNYSEAVNAYRDYVIKNERLDAKQSMDELKPVGLSEAFTHNSPSLYERAIRFADVLRTRREYRLRLRNTHLGSGSPLSQVHPKKRELVVQGARIKNHIDDLENLVDSESLSQEEFDLTKTQLARWKNLYESKQVQYEK